MRSSSRSCVVVLGTQCAFRFNDFSPCMSSSSVNLISKLLFLHSSLSQMFPPVWRLCSPLDRSLFPLLCSLHTLTSSVYYLITLSLFVHVVLSFLTLRACWRQTLIHLCSHDLTQGQTADLIMGAVCVQWKSGNLLWTVHYVKASEHKSEHAIWQRIFFRFMSWLIITSTSQAVFQVLKICD